MKNNIFALCVQENNMDVNRIAENYNKKKEKLFPYIYKKRG